MDHKIDFLGIGAPKSGTTSLFHYMLGHPQIFMPTEKELPFFNGVVNPELWETYYRKHFSGSEGMVKGKITPQYMNLPETPKNIHEYLPDVKLIVILRNPIDRAYSYFAMKKRNDTEQRTFEEVVHQQMSLKDSAIESVYDSYLKKSEYGKILTEYLKYFKKEQFLILFSDELKNKKKESLEKVFSFIGVDPNFIPSNVNKEFFVGGDKMKFSSLHNRVKKNLLSRTIIDLLPKSTKKQLRHWYFNEFNVIKSKDPIAQNLRSTLIDYFKSDVRELERSFDLIVPWSEFNKGEEYSA